MAQLTEYALTLSTDVDAGYTAGLQSGARDIAGPFDLDNDGNAEILVADYTGGGRVHVIENTGFDLWELVYSTPLLDSTGTTENIRAIAGGDLDGDGNGEIMFFAGRFYSETNPNASTYIPGLYVFENQGNDNFGDAPASIYDFPDDPPNRWRIEQLDVSDIDGDGDQEVYFGNNGNNAHDDWYVLSVTGDIGTGFETWVQELRLNSRNQPQDEIERGGGSPYAIHPADLNGDGVYELSLHSWNFFNFTTYGTDGAGGYVAPDTMGGQHFYQASFPDDDVSFFGGVVVDINDDGDDEIFYPNLFTRNISILNYEAGENPLQISGDNLVLDVIEGFSDLGITAADLDGDGQYELIGTGPGYSGADFAAGNPAEWVNLVEFNGGDPEDPMSYSSVSSIASPMDNYDGFHTVNLLDGTVVNTDNAIDVSIRDTVIVGLGDPAFGNAEFASKLTFLGDPDLDGVYEIAFGIQGVRDSLYTLTQQAPDSNFVISSVVANENRTFMRIMSTGGNAVSVEDERIILPNDYQLHANYPNPFNPSTTISFTLPLEKAISVKVYDITGRLIRTLVNNEVYPQGTFEVTWDGNSAAGGTVASGTYLYTLEYGNFRQTRKMTFIK